MAFGAYNSERGFPLENPFILFLWGLYMENKITLSKKQLVGSAVTWLLGVTLLICLGIGFKSTSSDYIVAFLFLQLLLAFYAMSMSFNSYKDNKRLFNLILSILFLIASAAIWVAIYLLMKDMPSFTGHTNNLYNTSRFAAFALCGAIFSIGFVIVLHPLLKINSDKK